MIVDERLGASYCASNHENKSTLGLPLILMRWKRMGSRGHFCWWAHSGLPVGMVVDVKQINFNISFHLSAGANLFDWRSCNLCTSGNCRVDPVSCILIQAHILSILSQAASSTAAWCCILVKQKIQWHFRVWALVVLFYLWKLFWTFNWGLCFRIVKNTFLAACLRTIRSMFAWDTSQFPVSLRHVGIGRAINLCAWLFTLTGML